MTVNLSPLLWRRLHSFTGLFITLYLIEHLLVNSQAALWIGDEGAGFVRAVNGIQNLPYLPLLEIFLLGVPIGIHMAWGIYRLNSTRANSWPTDGSKPSLTEYPRNHAYTWQRITSWILAIALLAHVVHMRFVDHPVQGQAEGQTTFTVRLTRDPNLEGLAGRLAFQLIEQNGQLYAEANNFGTAELLVVRETFKMPLMLALYTLFVLSACYHAFNGMWTFMITWGITVTERSQRWMRTVTTGLMALVAFLGLSAIWGSYWVVI